MATMVGDCIGGPLHGQRLAHWQDTKKFYRPMVAAFPLSDNASVEAVEIGEYKLNDFGQWHWWGTKEGRAFDTLFGAAKVAG